MPCASTSAQRTRISWKKAKSRRDGVCVAGMIRSLAGSPEAPGLRAAGRVLSSTRSARRARPFGLPARSRLAPSRARVLVGASTTGGAMAFEPANPSVTPTKTHRDENFPVASRLIAPRLRPAVLAFYRFVRAADDIADSPDLAPDEKLRRLDALEAELTARGTANRLAADLAEADSSFGAGAGEARLLQ